MTDRSLGGFGDPLHEFLLGDVPHVVGTRGRVDPGFADAAVGAADADVLVGTAETALGVALEVGEGDHGIIVEQVVAHGHGLEPLATLHGDRHHALFVHDVDGAEGPAVDFQGLTVLLGRVAVALVVGVGLDDVGIGEVLLHQGFDPFARNDVGAVLFTGVELDAHAAGNLAIDFLVGLDKTFGGKVAGKVNNGFLSGTLVVGKVLAPVGSLGLGLALRTAAGHEDTRD